VTRPLIAVTGMPSPQVKGLRRRGVVASEKVLEAVFRAGGDPVILPPAGHPVGPLLSRFDGVLLPGGADVDPRRYGGSLRGSSTYTAEDVQDVFDLAVARHAVEHAMPLFAICRGMQILNVALGGDLIQDLEATCVPHRDGYHRVDLDADGRTAAAMGSRGVVVSSYHHQAIRRLGTGLTVTGRAIDGVIEVVEHATAPVLAVQWHPEDNADLVAEQQALFTAHVELARAAVAAA
jgi:putative glutamine amidotransferase